MRKVIINCLSVAFIIGFCLMAFNSTLYPLTTKVDYVDTQNDIVYIVDFNGEEWSFTGSEDWSEGDCCTMLMCTMLTKNIHNDVIIDTHYDNWMLL